MFKKILLLASILSIMLAPVLVFASGVYRYVSAHDQAVTATSAHASFVDNRSGGTGVAFRAVEVTVNNNGDKGVYVDLDDITAVADSNSYVAPGVTRKFQYMGSDMTRGGGWSGWAAVAGGSDSSTIYIEAVRGY